jgi:hypothetical protein
MKSKLALLLTATFGFAVATAVFAQEAMNAGSEQETMQNSEITNNAVMNSEEAAPVEEAPAAGPAAY